MVEGREEGGKRLVAILEPRSAAFAESVWSPQKLGRKYDVLIMDGKIVLDGSLVLRAENGLERCGVRRHGTAIITVGWVQEEVDNNGLLLLVCTAHGKEVKHNHASAPLYGISSESGAVNPQNDSSGWVGASRA